MPIAIQSIFAFISGTGISFCPDTPRWYYARSRIEEGDQTLARLHGVYFPNTTSPTPGSDSTAMQTLKESIITSIRLEAEQENKLSWTSLIWDTTPLRVGRRVRISFMILSIQQMMGIDIIVYYMTLIFLQVGLSSFFASLLAAVALTIQFGGSLCCIPTIERVGRRKMMLYSAAAQSVCMLAFVLLNGVGRSTSATQWAAAIIMFPYLFMYGWGWVTCPWLYGPEIAPLKYRHIGAAAGLFGMWLFTFLTVFAGGIGIQTAGWKIWIWPLIFNVLGFLFVYFMCPDPTGKTLEEVDALFARDGHVEGRLEQKSSVEEIEDV
ncbi:hypothetical protein AWENTII_012550 [Aspergillus wentii]